MLKIFILCSICLIVDARYFNGGNPKIYIWQSQAKGDGVYQIHRRYEGSVPERPDILDDSLLGISQSISGISSAGGSGASPLQNVYNGVGQGEIIQGLSHGMEQGIRGAATDTNQNSETVLEEATQNISRDVYQGFTKGVPQKEIQNEPEVVLYDDNDVFSVGKAVSFDGKDMSYQDISENASQEESLPNGTFESKLTDVLQQERQGESREVPQDNKHHDAQQGTSQDAPKQMNQNEPNDVSNNVSQNAPQVPQEGLSGYLQGAVRDLIQSVLKSVIQRALQEKLDKYDSKSKESPQRVLLKKLQDTPRIAQRSISRKVPQGASQVALHRISHYLPQAVIRGYALSIPQSAYRGNGRVFNFFVLRNRKRFGNYFKLGAGEIRMIFKTPADINSSG